MSEREQILLDFLGLRDYLVDEFKPIIDKIRHDYSLDDIRQCGLSAVASIVSEYKEADT